MSPYVSEFWSHGRRFSDDGQEGSLTPLKTQPSGQFNDVLFSNASAWANDIFLCVTAGYDRPRIVLRSLDFFDRVEDGYENGRAVRNPRTRHVCRYR